MERRPGGPGPGEFETPADPPSPAEGHVGARVLAFPHRPRLPAPDRPPEPATSAREVEIRYDPATGSAVLSGVGGVAAAYALLPFGLQPRSDGCWEGVIARGDVRLLLATWSDLLEETWRGSRAPATPARAGRRELPRGSAAHTSAVRSSDESGVCPICGRRPVRFLGTGAGLPGAYPDLVCPTCDVRARDAGGLPLDADAGRTGANPVYIDGRRCWRLYRFGGWVTLLDRDGALTLVDFLKRSGATPPLP